MPDVSGRPSFCINCLHQHSEHQLHLQIIRRVVQRIYR